VARRAGGGRPAPHAESHIGWNGAVEPAGPAGRGAAVPQCGARGLDRAPPVATRTLLFNSITDGMDAYASGGGAPALGGCFAPPLYKGRRYGNVPDPERDCASDFVSADSARSVSFFLGRFRLHDRDPVELVCYASGRKTACQPSEVQRSRCAADR